MKYITSYRYTYLHTNGLALSIVGITERAGEGGAGREIGDDVPLETEGEGEGVTVSERGEAREGCVNPPAVMPSCRPSVPPSLRPSIHPSAPGQGCFSQGWFMGRG